MPNCAIVNCKNYSRCTKGSNIKYFRFPKNEDVAKQWIIACRREDRINLKNATICSMHFEQKYFEIPLIQRLLNYSPKNARHLKDEAVPTLNLPGEERTLGKGRRRKEVKDSTSSCILEAPITETITEESELPTHKEQELISTLPNIEKDPTCSYGLRAELVKLKQKIKILESQNKQLLKEIEKSRSNTVLLVKGYTLGLKSKRMIRCST